MNFFQCLSCYIWNRFLKFHHIQNIEENKEDINFHRYYNKIQKGIYNLVRQKYLNAISRSYILYNYSSNFDIHRIELNKDNTTHLFQSCEEDRRNLEYLWDFEWHDLGYKMNNYHMSFCNSSTYYGNDDRKHFLAKNTSGFHNQYNLLIY